jgi:RHS repeat-associated protein
VRQTAYLQGAHGVIKSLLNNIYYYQDKLGSTTHIADGSGALLESYRYDLYGTPTYYDSLNNPLSTTHYAVNDLYAGERWIGELSMYDLRNRFMSPELGRFLQSDPIGFKGDASNLYRYCGNDPVGRIDPMGLFDINLIPALDPRKGHGDYKAISPDRITVGAHGGPTWMANSN